MPVMEKRRTRSAPFFCRGSKKNRKNDVAEVKAKLDTLTSEFQALEQMYFLELDKVRGDLLLADEQCKDSVGVEEDFS